MEDTFSPPHKMAPGSDRSHTPHWFPYPREVVPFPLPQDWPLLSYYDPPRMDYYYGALCSLPAPGGGRHSNGEGFYGPAYIRKRNERERQRVKSVNDGYAALRRHLPPEHADRRMSKAQTLRAAIRHIHRLQEALHWGAGTAGGDSTPDTGNCQYLAPSIGLPKYGGLKVEPRSGCETPKTSINQ